MIRMDMKKVFFNERRVQQYIDKKTRKALSKFGAFVRRTAQQSMRSRKGTSPPGSPPYAHGQKLLKKHYYFYFDIRSKSVIVGPALLQNRSTYIVPGTLEHGGNVIQQTRRGPVARIYEQRAFTGPAVEKHRGNVAKWMAE